MIESRPQIDTDYFLELADLRVRDRWLWFPTEDARDAAAIRELKAGHKVRYEDRAR